jgi:uncharacterized protein GlcG (DUF336 family)
MIWEDLMTAFHRLALAGLAVCVLAAPASAQTVARKELSIDGALTIATAAMAECKAKGYSVSVAVVGRTGELLVHLRGDGAAPHNMENAFKKAYTSRAFRVPSGEMEERLKKNPQMGAQYLTGFTTGRGALPIKIGDDTIGAIGVSGAPSGNDAVCAKAGIDKVADQLK